MEKTVVSKEQFLKALDLFIDNTFTPKVPASEYLFYYGKLAIMVRMINRNWHRLADEDGTVDISEFYEHYMKMFEKTNRVEYQGFVMTKNDLNELMSYIKLQAPGGV